MSPATAAPARHSPAWCVLRHGKYTGEEDQVHLSDSTFVRNTMVRLCMTVNPVTGAQDGPYVLLGTDEYTLEDTATLVEALSGLLFEAGRDPTPHAES